MKEIAQHQTASSQAMRMAGNVEEKLRFLQQTLQSFDLSDLGENDRREMQARMQRVADSQHHNFLLS